MTSPVAHVQPCTPTYGDGSAFRTHHAAVYQLCPALEHTDANLVSSQYEFIIVSTVATAAGYETLAVPADPRGVLLSWGELSWAATADHAVVLAQLGYALPALELGA